VNAADARELERRAAAAEERAAQLEAVLTALADAPAAADLRDPRMIARARRSEFRLVQGGAA
jgi:hypothetical protein